MPGASLLPDRVLIGVAVVLTCVLFTRQALDPVNVIKLTALMLVALTAVAVALWRVVRHRTLALPITAAVPAAVAFGLALLVAAVTAPVLATAVVGTYGRNSGLLAYGAALVLFLLGVRAFLGQGGRVLVGAVVIAGLFTATYGLLQRAGIDAIPWNNPFNPIIAALGNPNFASGYLGVAACVAVGGALDRGWLVAWRILSAVTALLALLTAALSDSVQGPIAAGAGLLVVALAFSLDLTSRPRRAALFALGTVTALGLVTLVVGAASAAGPAARIFSDVGSEARTHYWGAALQMFRDSPVTGVGLDHYGAFWRTARSVESAQALGGADYSDAAHSVPLQMLAQGGLLLALAYAAFVLAVLVALVQGLRRQRGADRMLLGALGGGWAAYQVSSAVSIDQVPLIVLHFALAAAVVGAAGGVRVRSFRLPGALVEQKASPNDARTKRRVAAASPKVRTVTSGDLVILGLIVVLALGAAWSSLSPIRANTAAKEGDDLLARNDGSAAFREYDRATTALGGQAVYWIKKGELFQRASPPQLDQAQAAFLEAAERDPYEVNAVRAAARAAEERGDVDLSRDLYRRAVALEPLSPDNVVAAATFELRHSGAEQARTWLENAVRRTPASAGLWATLGDARLVLGDRPGAQEAYGEALSRDAQQATALAGLQKLRS